MTRLQIIAVRFALLALLLGAWELLPRNGIINPMLLPPLSDVVAMLAQLLHGGPESTPAPPVHCPGGSAARPWSRWSAAWAPWPPACLRL